MKKNQAAFDIGQQAERLAQGYYTYLTTQQIAEDPRAEALIPERMPGYLVSIGVVRRKDGSEHAFNSKHFLGLATKDADISARLKQVWLTGSLITLGDMLARQRYFDRAPELELVRHLRNGIAHGNRFRIDDPAKLAKFPAHNRLAWVQSDKKTLFEITPSLSGQPVLFDFMDAGDVLDLLMSVGLYLVRMGNGDPLRA